jgi:hypothetical protein|tara:strand:- start:590 stop:1195 length:606 start_codon:yes stop_codon:yes gene_type:complete
MSHSTIFPEFDVPAQFDSPMFFDCSWGNDCCPSFVIKDSMIGDECSIKIWVDHVDLEQRESGSLKRFSLVRETPFFAPQTLLETDNMKQLFVWILTQNRTEKTILKNVNHIGDLWGKGVLHQYTYGEFGEQLFKIKSFPTSLIVLTFEGYLELREMIDGQDVEVNRNYRCSKMIDNLPNLNRCQTCEKLSFNQCEKCNETN